jgi:hypothetical protein
MFPCQKINHAVVLVAWLAEENAYKLMNSWGRDWGENGFFRVEQRDLDDTCFIEREAFLPVVKEDEIIEPKPNPSPKPKPNPFGPLPVPNPNDCAVFFPSCEKNDGYFEKCSNSGNIKENFDGKLSGMVLGKFKGITLFEGPNCTGQTMTIKNDFRCMKNTLLSNLIDKVKSVVLLEEEQPKPECFWIYDDNCFGGERVEICGNIANVNETRLKDKIGSIKLGKKIWTISTFSEPNYKGTTAVRTMDFYSIIDSPIKNIQSIKLLKY